MLDWLFAALERYGKSNPARLARSAEMIPYWVIRRIARAKLARTLRHVWDRNAMQRERWQAAGIRRRHLRSPRVLGRIPLLDPDEVAADPDAYNCVPKNDLTFLMTTGGTGGRKRQVFFTSPDMDQQASLLAAGLRRLPGASCVLIIIGAHDDSYGPADVARRSVEKAGLRIFHTSGGPADRLIGYIREHQPDIIISFPSILHRLTVDAGDMDLRALGVKYMVISAQPLPRSLRKLLMERWGVTVIDFYGTAEHGGGIASECPAGDGLHVAETDFWMEILDPETHEPVPDGTEGEIVLTTLSRRGMPLVRYPTRDLSHFLPAGRCSCGVPLRRIAPIRRRIDHMLCMGPGLNFYPDQFETAVFSIPGVTDYQVIVSQKEYRDVISLTVEASEPTDGLADRALEALRTVKYLNGLNTETGHILFGEFKVVPPGTLAKGRRKSRRIVDNRVI